MKLSLTGGKPAVGRKVSCLYYREEIFYGGVTT